MANEEHLKILRQGVEVWNKWREDNPDIIPDLRWAVLKKTDLSGAYLVGADLSEANFSNASIGDTIFANVDLSTERIDPHCEICYALFAASC